MLAVSLAACAPIPLHAPGPPPELRSAVSAAHPMAIHGPADVRLAERTILELQAGFAFIPPAAGERLLRAMGERTRERLLGVVVMSAADAAVVAAIYAGDPRYAGIPELELSGWRDAPALIGFRQR